MVSLRQRERSTAGRSPTARKLAVGCAYDPKLIWTIGLVFDEQIEPLEDSQGRGRESLNTYEKLG